MFSNCKNLKKIISIYHSEKTNFSDLYLDMDYLINDSIFNYSASFRPISNKATHNEFVCHFDKIETKNGIVTLCGSEKNHSLILDTNKIIYQSKNCQILVGRAPGINYSLAVKIIKIKSAKELTKLLKRVKLQNRFSKQSSGIMAVDICGLCQDEDNNLQLLLATEKYEKDLCDFFIDLAEIEKKRRISVVKSFIKIIGAVLKTIHNAGYIHFDVKPANVLVKMNFKTKKHDFKLFDLDFSASITDIEKKFLEYGISGSAEYLSPERFTSLEHKKLTYDKKHISKSDVWAFAISIIELLNAVPLYELLLIEPWKLVAELEDKPKNITEKALASAAFLKKTDDKDLYYALESMFAFDLEDRLDMNMFFKHFGHLFEEKKATKKKESKKKKNKLFDKIMNLKIFPFYFGKNTGKTINTTSKTIGEISCSDAIGELINKTN